MDTGPLLTPHDPLIGQDVGGYVVEQPLGEGGMGLVYRARHPILNRHFAIKVLRPEVAEDARVSGSFEREAQTLSSLKHPNIIDIVGFGPLGDRRQYMVMEFLEGRTLEAELRLVGPLPPERALRLADQILDALAAAHSVNVIHRDLKPSNVFLARLSGGAELVKLLDFGLAKVQPEALSLEPGTGVTGASVVCGTPEYFSPEQAQGQPASRSSDLYSFGVMLFEVLTGQLPFQVDLARANRAGELLRLHRQQQAPTLCAVAGSYVFSEELEESIADLLKKRPAERPSSAATVRSRLQRAARGVQDQVTRQQRNPLLSPAPDARLSPRIDAAEPAPAPSARAQGRGGRWAVGVAALGLLLGAWLLWGRGGVPVADRLWAPPPSVEAPAMLPVRPSDPVLAPRETLPAPSEELTPLPPLLRCPRAARTARPLAPSRSASRTASRPPGGGSR